MANYTVGREGFESYGQAAEYAQKQGYGSDAIQDNTPRQDVYDRENQTFVARDVPEYEARAIQQGSPTYIRTPVGQYTDESAKSLSYTPDVGRGTTTTSNVVDVGGGRSVLQEEFEANLQKAVEERKISQSSAESLRQNYLNPAARQVGYTSSGETYNFPSSAQISSGNFSSGLPQPTGKETAGDVVRQYRKQEIYLEGLPAGSVVNVGDKTYSSSQIQETSIAPSFGVLGAIAAGSYNIQEQARYQKDKAAYEERQQFYNFYDTYKGEPTKLPSNQIDKLYLSGISSLEKKQQELKITGQDPLFVGRTILSVPKLGLQTGLGLREEFRERPERALTTLAVGTGIGTLWGTGEVALTSALSKQAAGKTGAYALKYGIPAANVAFASVTGSSIYQGYQKAPTQEEKRQVLAETSLGAGGFITGYSTVKGSSKEINKFISNYQSLKEKDYPLMQRLVLATKEPPLESVVRVQKQGTLTSKEAIPTPIPEVRTSPIEVEIGQKGVQVSPPDFPATEARTSTTKRRTTGQVVSIVTPKQGDVSGFYISPEKGYGSSVMKKGTTTIYETYTPQGTSRVTKLNDVVMSDKFIPKSEESLSSFNLKLKNQQPVFQILGEDPYSVVGEFTQKSFVDQTKNIGRGFATETKGEFYTKGIQELGGGFQVGATPKKLSKTGFTSIQEFPAQYPYEAKSTMDFTLWGRNKEYRESMTSSLLGWSEKATSKTQRFIPPEFTTENVVVPPDVVRAGKNKLTGERIEAYAQESRATRKYKYTTIGQFTASTKLPKPKPSVFAKLIASKTGKKYPFLSLDFAPQETISKPELPTKIGIKSSSVGQSRTSIKSRQDFSFEPASRNIPRTISTRITSVRQKDNQKQEQVSQPTLVGINQDRLFQPTINQIKAPFEETKVGTTQIPITKTTQVQTPAKIPIQRQIPKQTLEPILQPPTRTPIFRVPPTKIPNWVPPPETPPIIPFGGGKGVGESGDRFFPIPKSRRKSGYTGSLIAEEFGITAKSTSKRFKELSERQYSGQEIRPILTNQGYKKSKSRRRK